MKMPLRQFLLIWIWLAAALVSSAANWPMYRHDAHRSGVTEEKLSLPLRLAWQYVAPQPPSPAWPPPGKLLNRTDFDYASHPVIAQGIVCFGSSSDDTIRALDAKTGREKWHFITGGPVRFAPAFAEASAFAKATADKTAGKPQMVYFASDDGFVYCLDAGTGKLVWKFQAALRDERLIGNHRMISRWPVRTGVLVADGMVYCVAGMWNTEGVFIYALQADTGKVVWCNDTTGFLGVTTVDFLGSPSEERFPSAVGHQGEFGANGRNGISPQGPLLIGGDVLLTPTGNGAPLPLNRRTGAPIAWTWDWDFAIPAGIGGTWLTIDGEKMYAFGARGPGTLRIASFSVATGANVGQRWKNDSLPQLTIVPMANIPDLIHERGKVSAIVHDGKLYARKAYGMALAGATLLVGEDGAVVAQDPDTERVLWRSAVAGEAREIAVADGRLYVGASSGAIYCFEPGVAPLETKGQMTEDRGQRTAISNQQSSIINRLQASGMDRGFALVVGDADGRISFDLATHTQLQVINALTDEAAAGALREKLLAQTPLYGSRIHVQTVARLDQLPFTQYFANAVIVAGLTTGLSGKELYRVLRPCGGIMLFYGLSAAESRKLIEKTGALECEIHTPQKQTLNTEHRTLTTEPAIIRGKLPGAVDWDSRRGNEWRPDQRVKWPLRPLWFGGPSTAQVQLFQQGAPGPLMANGRYFMRSERFLTAVDAYNGAVLWSRSIPQASPDLRAVDGVIYAVSEPTKYGREDLIRGLTANDDFVYLQLGAAYFRGNVLGKGDGRIQLDARTGEQKAISGPFIPPTLISLKTPQSWSLEAAPKRSGAIVMESTARGLALTLTTKDPVVTKLDAWELFFDFRPPEARYGLYERGAFQVRVAMAQDKNTPASWNPGAGPAHPNLEVTGMREASGTKTTVVVPWAEINKLMGGKPSSFGFAATLDSHDGGRDEPIVRQHLFGDWTADGLNNGWACVVLDGSALPVDATKPPSIIVGALKDRAGGISSTGEFVGSAREAPRIHPLTGEPEPKMFRIGACGGLACSEVLRSGSQSIYDFADDSGMRSVGGIKVRCTSPELVGLGLLLFSEENGHCACNYPVRTSLALAPAEKRLNEDWAFFFGRPADTQVRQAAINLGAPGDRRDDSGTLWLGYPRLPANKSLTYPLTAGTQRSVGANGVWFRILSAALQVPMEVECFGGADAYRPEEDTKLNPQGWHGRWSPGRNRKEFGPYRINADRADIRGTDRPWIYASGYRGIRKAIMKLNFLPPLVSALAAKPPAMNATLDASAWQGEPQARLPFTHTEIFLQHDADNLYVAARRPPVVNKRGERAAWAATNTGENAAVWNDDSFEVFFGDAERAVHLGVSASGGRYDALAAGTNAQDKAWDGAWKSAVAAGTNGLAFKLAIPWKMLADAGLKKDQLGINCQMNQKDVSGESFKAPGLPPGGAVSKGTAGEALCYLGITGREHCRNFAPLRSGAPPKIEPRQFTVRLHFAELDDVKPGQRVFDVKLQDQVVLKGFDVVKEAGGAHTALVKEFKNVRAGEALTFEFIAEGKELTAATAPILSALELVEEGFRIDRATR